MIAILIVLWIIGMASMHKNGSRSGFNSGNISGVSNTLKVLEGAGVITEDDYRKVLMIMRGEKDV